MICLKLPQSSKYATFFQQTVVNIPKLCLIPYVLSTIQFDVFLKSEIYSH